MTLETTSSVSVAAPVPPALIKPAAIAQVAQTPVVPVAPAVAQVQSKTSLTADEMKANQESVTSIESEILQDE